jgi:hypothetical protein
MAKTPIDRLLDGLNWQVLPPARDPLPGTLYATHQGVLKIGGAELKCYTLNNGQRVIDQESLEKFFSPDA